MIWRDAFPSARFGGATRRKIWIVLREGGRDVRGKGAVHVYSVCFYVFIITIMLRTRLPWDTDQTRNRPRRTETTVARMCAYMGLPPFPSGAKRFMPPSCVTHTLPILRTITTKVYTRTYMYFYTSMQRTYKDRTSNRNRSIDIAFVLTSRPSCPSPTTILIITTFARTPTMSSACSGTRHARRTYCIMSVGKHVRHVRRSVGRHVSFVPP